ncbi:ATP-binding protein [Streptomyces sp. NPDC059740]|uniref:ATP-binding protein n=1 Tax=Streptomyces sp. NPDC059740 TaxID=3346926 RepID=UPI003663AE38
MPGDLGVALGRFVGRRAETAALAEDLERSRLVTLTGPGGVGKSRLARWAAFGVQDRFPHGVWRVDLSAVRDPGVVAHAAARALGLADNTDRPPAEVLVDHLRGREVLLVLDGFEQVAQACAELADHLLRRLPRLRVLAVGRCLLGLAGEVDVVVPPLAEADALELLTDRAARVVTGFPAQGPERAAALEICRRLDGLPLALELAAGRLRTLSARQVLDRLDDRFRLLTGGAAGSLPRHRTMRLAIGWSHELCEPRERLLWARLSVFAGDFDLSAAEYVCSGAELPAHEVLEVLEELAAQSLLTRTTGPAGLRFRMLDTVRAYGASWLELTDDDARLRRRHRDWYVGLATACELDWFGPRQTEVAARVDVEMPNLRLAMENCLADAEEAYLGQYLAGTLWFHWVGCGRLAEGRHWLGRALAVRGHRDEARLKALWVAGYVAVIQGDALGAVAALEECRVAALHSGNERAAAYGLHRTGCLALLSDDMPGAERLLREALADYRRIGELNSNVLMGQVELALALVFQDDLSGAEQLCREVQEVCQDHGERWTAAYALFVLAFAAWSRGEMARARSLLVESLTVDHAFHDLLGAVLAIELLALVTLDDGVAAPGGERAAAEEAAVLQGAAERIWPSVGLPLFGSRYFNRPHQLCRDRALQRLGERRYEECRAEGRRLDLDETVARVLCSAVLSGPREAGSAGPVMAREQNAPDGLDAPKGK